MTPEQARKDHDKAQREAHTLRGEIAGFEKFIDNFLSLDKATVDKLAYERTERSARICEASLPGKRKRLAESEAVIAATAPIMTPATGPTIGGPRSFVFNMRTSPLSPDEADAMTIPAFLRRDANNVPGFLRGINCQPDHLAAG